MITHSKIHRGSVGHRRLAPTEHVFSYPMTFFSFDLSELKAIESTHSLFGYNRARPVQIRDSDYLRGQKTEIIDQLAEYLPASRLNERTLLVTSPRYLGYAFNPVNFYLRLRGSELCAAVAEVNNTFGDRHIYPLLDLKQDSTNSWKARCPKDFHVSPFNDLDGEYEFTFKIDTEDLFIGVDLYKQNVCQMQTWIEGKSRTLTNRTMTRYALMRPMDTALNTMPRILWQAARLYFEKKLTVHKRPSPSSEHTVIDRDDADRPARIV